MAIPDGPCSIKAQSTGHLTSRTLPSRRLIGYPGAPSYPGRLAPGTSAEYPDGSPTTSKFKFKKGHVINNRSTNWGAYPSSG